MAQAEPWRDPWEALIPPPPPGDGEAAPKPKPRKPPPPRKEEYPSRDWRYDPKAFYSEIIAPEIGKGLEEMSGVWLDFLEGMKTGWPWQHETEKERQQRESYEAWQARVKEPAISRPFKGPSEQIEAYLYAEALAENMFQKQRYKGFEEQVRAWERGERPDLPMPEPGMTLPPEWQEWYGQVTTPELHPEGAVSVPSWELGPWQMGGPRVELYSDQYAEEPGVTLPEDYHRKTDEEKAAWLNAHAYKTVYTDENGNIIDVSEVGRRALLDPDAPIRQAWFMGDNEVVMDEFSAGEIERREAIKPSEAALGRRGEVIGGKWFGEPTTPYEGERLMMAKEKEGIKATLESSIVQSVLTSEWGYEDKLETLVDLYSQYTGKVLSQRGAREVREAVFASLSPEEQEARRGREPAGPPAREARPPTVETKVDVEKLKEALAPYGVNLTANHPFISPITQAHLMRIPSETLELMSRYLEEKGVSWGDFLSISSSWYGGGEQRGRGHYAIPRQWG